MSHRESGLLARRAGLLLGLLWLLTLAVVFMSLSVVIIGYGGGIADLFRRLLLRL
jgi:hypothetical protein